MSSQSIPPGFHPVKRRDGIFEEKVHDAYKATGKLSEPTVCPQCKAVYRGGRWRWETPPAEAHRGICPACHRMHDHYPAGFVSLSGDFFQEHRDEIVHLIRNHEEHERAEHPLKRIMDMEIQNGGVLVTTTDIHLARGIGEAVHHAYQGDLEYHYNPAENLLRVHWKH